MSVWLLFISGVGFWATFRRSEDAKFKHRLFSFLMAIVFLFLFLWLFPLEMNDFDWFQEPRYR